MTVTREEVRVMLEDIVPAADLTHEDYDFAVQLAERMAEDGVTPRAAEAERLYDIWLRAVGETEPRQERMTVELIDGRRIGPGESNGALNTTGQGFIGLWCRDVLIMVPATQVRVVEIRRT